MVAIGRDLDHTMIAAAQKSDPVLHTVLQQVSCKEKPSLTGNWRKFPFKEIPSNLVSAHSTSVYTVPQSEDSNNVRRETAFSCTSIYAETTSEECP